MPDVFADTRDMPESGATGRVMLSRLLAGLLQGIIFYLLFTSLNNHGWLAAHKFIFTPLLYTSIFTPTIFISSLGHLKAVRLWGWVSFCFFITWLLGYYAIWRIGDQAPSLSMGFPVEVIFPLAIVFYIAQALVLAADSDNRRLASYPSYFEMSWKLITQVVFSGGFLGVLWAVLGLGAFLFSMIKLQFFSKLLGSLWFSFPVSTIAFAFGLHITDVRPSIVRGFRNLLLVLMSWLLPVVTLIVAGFLLSLPWTGLAPLWATRHAASLLLVAAAVLVLLINAAFQNGEVGAQIGGVLQNSTRVAAVLLTPIVVIASYALWLRVQDYGWSMDRILAAACILVAGCYAGGYLWAVFSRGAWLARIAPTNIATAFVILSVLLALSSPLADPARLSVADLVTRLKTGKTSAAKFDFNYLKSNGVRYGMDALQQLKTYSEGTEAALIRDKAATSWRGQKQVNADALTITAGENIENIKVWPQGSTLPQTFLTQTWGKNNMRLIPTCLTAKGKQCDAYLIDFNGDKKQEILILPASENIGANTTLFALEPNGAWVLAGFFNYQPKKCQDEVRKALTNDAYRVVTPSYNDLEILGQRLHFMPIHLFDCNKLLN